MAFYHVSFFLRKERPSSERALPSVHVQEETCQWVTRETTPRKRRPLRRRLRRASPRLRQRRPPENPRRSPERNRLFSCQLDQSEPRTCTRCQEFVKDSAGTWTMSLLSACKRASRTVRTSGEPPKQALGLRQVPRSTILQGKSEEVCGRQGIKLRGYTDLMHSQLLRCRAFTFGSSMEYWN